MLTFENKYFVSLGPVDDYGNIACNMLKILNMSKLEI